MDDNQTKLKAYILELSLNSLEVDVDEAISKLQLIYVDDFRHYYSEIFGTITVIKNDDKYDLQVLTENINKIFQEVRARHDNPEKLIDEEFFLKAKKLYDHINLDVARIKYTETLVNKITEQNRTTNEELRKINDKAEKMQRDYVTILGIFAAVIIAFVSGMTFSTSVLNNIGSVSIYRLTFIVILIALFIFNLLNLLFDFLIRINKIPPSSNGSVIGTINSILAIALIADIVLWGIYWYRISNPTSCLNALFPV